MLHQGGELNVSHRSRVVASVLFLFLLAACGGSSGRESQIEGVWKGSLIQGVISCSDGAIITACSGCAIGETSLEISGADEPGASVFAEDGDCRMEGVRSATGFSAAPVAGCYEALERIDFELEGAGRAVVYYYYDRSKVPVNPGEVACVAGSYAELTRING
jgi:hypothetical protein